MKPIVLLLKFELLDYCQYEKKHKDNKPKYRVCRIA